MSETLQLLQTKLVLSGPDWWGPHFWRIFHNVAAAAHHQWTEAHRTTLTTFYRNFYHLIPCSVCAQHYQNLLSTMPVPELTSDRTSAGELFHWTVSVHNAVNQRTGKPAWTVEQAIRQINASIPRRAIATSPETLHTPIWHIMLYIIIVVLILLVMVMAIRKLRHGRRRR